MFKNFVATHPSLVVERLIVDWIEEINELLLEQKEVTVALSGGSTPQLMFSMLAEHFSKALPWHRIHFFWVDERWVPHESNESNFGNACRLLFDRLDIDRGRLHPVQTHGMDPAEEAKRYAEEIKQKVSLYGNIPSFDIIFLGMGDDGHVASIFPGQEVLFETDDICAVTHHPINAQVRITITGKVINQAKNIVFLVTGKQKNAVLQTVFKASGIKYPVQRVKPVMGSISWYLDRDAARNIQNLQ